MKEHKKPLKWVELNPHEKLTPKKVFHDLYDKLLNDWSNEFSVDADFIGAEWKFLIKMIANELGAIENKIAKNLERRIPTSPDDGKGMGAGHKVW